MREMRERERKEREWACVGEVRENERRRPPKKHISHRAPTSGGEGGRRAQRAPAFFTPLPSRSGGRALTAGVRRPSGGVEAPPSCACRLGAFFFFLLLAGARERKAVRRCASPLARARPPSSLRSQIWRCRTPGVPSWVPLGGGGRGSGGPVLHGPVESGPRHICPPLLGQARDERRARGASRRATVGSLSLSLTRRPPHHLPPQQVPPCPTAGRPTACWARGGRR
jgi:hypothetical protein